MEAYIPYIVTVLCSIISCTVSIIICNKNNKAEIHKLKEEYDLEFKKLKEEHELELKKMKENTKNQIDIIQKETESKIEVMKQEYALKAGTEIITSFVDKTTDAVYNSHAVKQKINQQTNKSFVANKNKKKH